MGYRNKKIVQALLHLTQALIFFKKKNQIGPTLQTQNKNKIKNTKDRKIVLVSQAPDLRSDVVEAEFEVEVAAALAASELSSSSRAWVLDFIIFSIICA